MKFPEELLYTREHEWILVEDTGGTVGITDYAQHELGDVVFVELPLVGESFGAQAPFASVESVKAVSEVYSPISCRITAVNELLMNSPETINQDPYGRGWMVGVRIDDPTQLKNLLSADAYRRYVEEELGA